MKNLRDSKLVKTAAGLLMIFLLALGFKMVNSPIELTDEEVPMGSVYHLDSKSLEIVNTIGNFEKWAMSHVQFSEGTDQTAATNDLTMALIRYDRYGEGLSGIQSGFWGEMAGVLPNDFFTTYAGEPLTKYRGELTNLDGFKDTITGNEVDFTHMIAVTDIYITDIYLPENQEIYYDLLMSTGGDLETFLIDAAKYKSGNKVIESDQIYDFAMKTIGTSKHSYFGAGDYLADLDGQNIAGMMKSGDLLLSEALLQYYQNGDAAKRRQIFVSYYGGQEAFSRRIQSFMRATPMDEDKSVNEMVEFMSSFQFVQTMMIKSVHGDISNLSEGDQDAVTQAFLELVETGR